MLVSLEASRSRSVEEAGESSEVDIESSKNRSSPTGIRELAWRRWLPAHRFPDIRQNMSEYRHRKTRDKYLKILELSLPA